MSSYVSCRSRMSVIWGPFTELKKSNGVRSRLPSCNTPLDHQLHFIQAFIYRLFYASDHRPRRLKMEDIKAAFPHYAESSVRKRLKMCSDFKRLGTGPDQNYWVREAFFFSWIHYSGPSPRVPFTVERRGSGHGYPGNVLCPVQYDVCWTEAKGVNSIVWNHLRFVQDAGYGERYFFAPENEDDSDDGVTIEDEVFYSYPKEYS